MIMDIYREVLMDHATNPRNVGSLGNEAKVAEEFNPLCGDRVRVFVNISDGKIEQVKYDPVGCAIAIGSASIISEEFVEKNLDEVRNWSLDDLLKLLGTKLTSSRRQCAMVALKAVKKAIE